MGEAAWRGRWRADLRLMYQTPGGGHRGTAVGRIDDVPRPCLIRRGRLPRGGRRLVNMPVRIGGVAPATPESLADRGLVAAAFQDNQRNTELLGQLGEQPAARGPRERGV